MEQALIWAVTAAPVAWAAQNIRRLRRTGNEPAARRLYRRAAWTLGLTVYAAMLTQEAILGAAGLLNARTGWPLHLCSLTGLLTLPMLLSDRRFLWHVSLYLGLPGALLALTFPAVAVTPWPRLTRAAFFTMHAGLTLAPLLPLSLGRRPSARGALDAAVFLLAAGAAAMAVNHLVGSNYLFVSSAVPGTPLEALANHGLAAYRLALAGLCLLTLGAEGLTVHCFTRRGKCRA